MPSPLEWITGTDDNLYRLDPRPSGRTLVQRDSDGMTWVVGTRGVCINRRNPLDAIVLEAASSYASKA